MNNNNNFVKMAKGTTGIFPAFNNGQTTTISHTCAVLIVKIDTYSRHAITNFNNRFTLPEIPDYTACV